MPELPVEVVTKVLGHGMSQPVTQVGPGSGSGDDVVTVRWSHFLDSALEDDAENKEAPVPEDLSCI
jgi:hypothetical protein